METPIYSLKDVEFTYSETEKNGIHGISIDIEKGKTILVCGESGCGKSTLLRVLNGLIPNYFEGKLEGQVLFDGKAIKDYTTRQLAEKVGTVFQNPKSQFFTLDSESEIVFGCENLGIEPNEIKLRTKKAIRDLHAEKLLGRDLFAMSGGEKQKIACCAVAAMGPDVILLDEPSSNLDNESIKELKKVLGTWKAEGKTIIIVEHRLQYVMDCADRVLYMKDGKIVKDCGVEEFKRSSPEDIELMGLRMTKYKCEETISDENNEKKESIVLDKYIYFYPKNGTPSLDISHVEFPENEIIAVVGNNGAGKSTFGDALCGLIPVKNAGCMYKNKVYRPRKMRGVAYKIFQDVNNQLFCESILNEMSLGITKKFQKTDSYKETVKTTLEKLNIYKKRQEHPMSLSGGEKQRTAIATALVQDKEIFVFDEPTSGLDLKNMKAVCEVLKKLKDKGKSVFVITHDPELIFRCCTYAVFFKDSQIQWMSSMNKETVVKLEEFFSA